MSKEIKIQTSKVAGLTAALTELVLLRASSVPRGVEEPFDVKEIRPTLMFTSPNNSAKRASYIYPLCFTRMEDFVIYFRQNHNCFILKKQLCIIRKINTERALESIKEVISVKQI